MTFRCEVTACCISPVSIARRSCTCFLVTYLALQGKAGNADGRVLPCLGPAASGQRPDVLAFV
jgi:hypothetical protein